jgi:hypothetical protein
MLAGVDRGFDADPLLSRLRDDLSRLGVAVPPIHVHLVDGCR